jgi:zinc protease
MKILTLIMIAAFLIGCSQENQESQEQQTQKIEQTDSEISGVTLVDEVKGEPGKTVIPYKKFVLDNGMKVILHEDHSDPLVHVDVTYHVGSGREEPGKSGFAHFFEHMMFQGSENIGDEQHFKLITEAGGTLNGTTNTDRTNYYQTVPANQLEKVIWMEADRMGFLVDAVTQEKYEVQRDTVKNERGQNYDNRPYGRVFETISAALYPEGHPYSWPTIGYLEDLDRVNVNDLKAFFLRWYGPNNATLTIGGDIDEKETLALVNKYFGSITQGPEVAMPEKRMVTLDKDRYISMEDNIHLPAVVVTFPTVHARHEDEAALDILVSIFGGGQTSLLYKNLVKNQVAVQATASHNCGELACSFIMFALPHPASGKSLADLEKVIRDTLVEFEKRGVKDDDLTKTKARMESQFIFGLQSVQGKVSTLAANETYTGNPNYIEQNIARYAKVTKEDVLRVYKKYIKDKSAIVLSIVPNGKLETIAAVDTFKSPVRTFLTQENETSVDELQLRKSKDVFDRSIMPVAGANKAVEIPQMWQDSLPNGIKILGTQSLETPTTSLLLKISAGHYFESKDKSGTAALLAAMLNEATTERTAEEMTLELQKLGSFVNITANNFSVDINVNALTKNIDATMKLVQEKLLKPAFIDSDFERNKKTAIQDIEAQKKDANYLARTAYRKLLNTDNIAALPIGGSEVSLSNISLDDVKAFYATHFKPAAGQMIIVTDLEQATISKSVALLNDWKGEGPKLNVEFPMPTTKKGVIYLVNKDDAPQSVIRMGKRSLKQDITGEYYKVGLMNFPLGGAFNSRINLNLREEKGYTYGARSFFNGNKLTGSYTATAQVRADVTDKSLVEFIKEIELYFEKGITAEEISFMRNAINQSDARRYETPGAKLNFLAQILDFDLTADFVKKRNEIVKSISVEEINALAKKHLNIKEMIMVVVGNSEVLKPQLEALGYEVVNYEI